MTVALEERRMLGVAGHKTGGRRRIAAKPTPTYQGAERPACRRDGATAVELVSTNLPRNMWLFRLSPRSARPLTHLRVDVRVWGWAAVECFYTSMPVTRVAIARALIHLGWIRDHHGHD